MNKELFIPSPRSRSRSSSPSHRPGGGGGLKSVARLCNIDRDIDISHARYRWKHFFVAL